MPKKGEGKASENLSLLVAALEETKKKIAANLIPSVEDHVNNEKFDSTDGLDFLDTKNGILLSYMIDLTQLLKLMSAKDKDADAIDACLGRLREMKIVLEKIRPLEKKMRYQLDKLLALSASSAAFSGLNVENNATESSDPLAFRPNPEALELKEDESDGEASDNFVVDDDDDDDDDSGSSSSEGEDDDELMAARATLNAGKKKAALDSDDEDDESDDDNVVENKGIYKAPRLAAVPFAEKEKQAEKEERILKKQRDRMRKSEFLSTLKATFGEAPEEDDMTGGAALGQQRDSSRRFADKQKEKVAYEEEAMVRLQVTRKEKKQQKKIMREELSNLNSIADIGNVAMGVSQAFGGDSDRRSSSATFEDRSSSRHANGKRKRDNEFDTPSRKGKKGVGAKNSFQKALYGMGGSGKKKKRGMK